MPAFFDDKDHYKNFYFDYEEGYGIIISQKYTEESRRLFRELQLYLGEKPQTIALPSSPLKDTLESVESLADNI